jgi:hypothetical protein
LSSLSSTICFFYFFAFRVERERSVARRVERCRRKKSRKGEKTRSADVRVRVLRGSLFSRRERRSSRRRRKRFPRKKKNTKMPFFCVTRVAV